MISTEERSATQASSTATEVKASGWHNGISSAVRFAAMIPARRATASTSPLPISPAWIRARVSGFITTRAPAMATRSVSALSETSTIWARPSRSVWRQVGEAQEAARRRRDIARSHQRLADQKTARAGGSEPVEIGGIVDAAFCRR